MLNHSFTLDMATSLAERLQQEAGENVMAQIYHAHLLCFARQPLDSEMSACHILIKEYSLAMLSRVLLNTSELIYVRSRN